MIDARSLALLDLLSRSYLVPARDDPAYERLMGEWPSRYRVRLAAYRCRRHHRNGGTMFSIAIACRSYGNDFEPRRADIATGHWHPWPSCRSAPDRKVSGDLKSDSSASEGHTALRDPVSETDPRS